MAVPLLVQGEWGIVFYLSAFFSTQFLRSHAQLVSSSFRLPRSASPSPMSPFTHFNSCSLSCSHFVDGYPDQHSLSPNRCVHNVQTIARALVADLESEFASRLILGRMKANNVHGNTMRQTAAISNSFPTQVTSLKKITRGNNLEEEAVSSSDRLVSTCRDLRFQQDFMHSVFDTPTHLRRCINHGRSSRLLDAA
ncbi:hypothetical protein BGY98DRAFT_203291 [Russula aff. rugulosa BPL654]|nr:hypothetical protein BGY98DRAFT_203291 [Russula aff. rugulosa BPL654]